MALYVRQLQVGPMQNFTYLVGPADRAETAVVDAAWDVPQILAAAREDGRVLTHALVTHRHFDHTNGLAALLAATDARVVVHAEDAEHLPAELPGGRVERVEADDTVDVGGLTIRCIHTPGHTPGSQCFLAQEGPGALFGGDTVFVNACGRCDLGGGDPARMFDSLHRVLGALPDETVLYPGHDYGDVPVSSLGRERQQNPYFRLATLDAFVAFRMRPRG